MKTLEYISTCFAIAGILFVFTLWEADRYGPLLAYPDTDAVCPDLQIRHGVGSDLRPGVKVVDACSAHVNVIKY